MTAREHLALDRESEQRYMFYAGEVFAMTGASRRHNLIVHRLADVYAKVHFDEPEST